MTRRSIFAAITAIACAGFLATYWANAQPPKPDAPAGDKAESLDVQCAKAFRDLARIKYKLLLSANQRVPGTTAKEKMQGMARVVAFAEASYDAAVAEQHGERPAAGYVKQAEDAAKKAEAKYKAAIKAHPLGAKSKVEFEWLSADAHLARLRAEKAKSLAGKGTVEYLSWRADLLSDQLISAVEP